jgi:low temperature requirement protein LtrA
LVEPRPETARVSTLELFFDLVFVFTVTQLTQVLVDRFDERGVLQVALMLGLIWWMYGGYAWLTNLVAPHSTNRRLLLLGGMGAYLVLALSIPEAFSGSGATFGLAYLVVVLVHSGLFSRALEVGNIVAVAPYNLLAALAVVGAGVAGGTPQYVVWAIVAVFLWLTPWLVDPAAFEIAPSHFVERHGLVVIVAIGESVVVIGIGAAGLPVDLPLVLVAITSLALSACLWWTYFGGGDDEAAERAMAGAHGARRYGQAINAFGYAHLLLLFGIIAIAAAQKKATGHAFDPLATEEAVALAGGLAVYLAGDALFRRSLAIGRVDLRLGVAVLALATIPLGTEGVALAQISVLVLLMTAMFALESRGPAEVSQAGFE